MTVLPIAKPSRYSILLLIAWMLVSPSGTHAAIPAGAKDERPPDCYFDQEVLVIPLADYSEFDRSLPFHLDALHQDLRAVVVRHIAK